MKRPQPVSSQQLAGSFSRMLDPGSRSVSASVNVALVYVVGGLHSGGHIKITRSPMTIGSSLRSDIVLRDVGVAQDHAEIVYDNHRWVIRSSRSNQALSVVQHRQRGRYLREQFNLGGAELVLSQPATDLAMAQYAPQTDRQPARALLIVGVLVFTGLFYGAAIRTLGSDSANRPPVFSELDLSAWPDVNVVQSENGVRQVSGYVDTVDERQALFSALGLRPSDNVLKLRSGDQLVTQLREVLDSQMIEVRYVGGGVIRLTGKVIGQVEIDRVKWVISEYENVVKVDNLIDFEATPREPVRRALPFRIVDVIPGANGSFGDQHGNRYFVGARLPDGSTLTAVHDDAVEFRLDNRPLIYPIR